MLTRTKIRRRRLMGSIAFSVLSLFASNEVGAWYDPSDMTTLFQDAAGTTPVTAVEQPVGLVLDKSRGLVLGSEQIVNGSFSADVSWEKLGGATISGGVAVLDSTSVTQGLTQSRSFALGRTYLVSMTWTGRISAGMGAYGSGDVRFVSNSTAGSFTGYVNLNAGTGASFWVLCPTGNTATIDNISVRELPGSHLSQSTAAARPVLSARVNLLTRTEEFDNAAWSKGNTSVTANATTDPLSGSTADAVFENALNAAHTVWLSVPTANSTSYTTSVYVKGIGRQYFRIRLGDGTTEFATVIDSVVFNLSGLGSISSAPSSGTASIEALANSWYRVSFTRASGTGGNTAVTFQFFQDASTGSYVGDITKGFYIWGADLRPANAGVGLPAYQRVGAATSGSSTAAGNADYDSGPEWPRYLRFDGVDDFLQSSTITPGSVDKAQVFAGVRKLSDAATNTVMELSTSLTTNNGVVSLFAPVSAGSTYSFASKGTNQSVATSVGSFAAPITNILTCLGDISGDRATLLVNGVQVDQSIGDQGTGNYLAHPIYVGARGGTSLRFNGHLYSLILRFSATNLDAATITATETWVNSKTKAY